jgi:hypothetical protein
MNFEKIIAGINNFSIQFETTFKSLASIAFTFIR